MFPSLLSKGCASEAGLLQRNHLESHLEHLKKTESDSGFRLAMRRDLAGAKDVQQVFFPPESLSIPCVACQTFYQPAHEFGGDYYDFLSLQGGRWGIAIGDVSGKGISAALIMASLHASLRAEGLHPHLHLSTLIGSVNRLVYESSPTHLFASLFYSEYEPATRMLKFVNAGHNRPSPEWVMRKCSYLNSTGMPVGISADSQFASGTFQFEIDDLLIAYTDGITETENDHGEPWGQQRLENLLPSYSRKTPEPSSDSESGCRRCLSCASMVTASAQVKSNTKSASILYVRNSAVESAAGDPLRGRLPR